MLPKKEKFSSEDFSKIKNSKSKKLITKYGFFLVFENERASVQNPIVAKKAIVLAKKNFKTAVKRNELKRLFYNTVLKIEKLKARSFVLFARKNFNQEDLKIDLSKI